MIMKINIGSNIKELRKRNNITQERLAEYIGVTYQTVSKWENGTSLPSISLLPSIANIFNISIDELYDIDKHTNDEKISVYEAEYEALCSKGDNQGRVELMRRALEEYPRNYEFMNYLARSLYRCYNIDLHSTEIIMLCDRILEECKTDSIRFSALQTILKRFQSDKSSFVRYLSLYLSICLFICTAAAANQTGFFFWGCWQPSYVSL